MNNKIITVIIIAVLIALIPSLVFANPLPDKAITAFSTDPDWIEAYSADDTILASLYIICNDDTFYVSDTIFTVWGSMEPFRIDSTLCPDLDIPDNSGVILIGDDEQENYEWGSVRYGIYNYHFSPPRDCHSFKAEMIEHEWIFYLPYLDHRIRGYFGETYVLINEISVGNTWGDGDFVELYNYSESIVDLSNWEIICNSRYIIPPDTYIKPHKFFTLREGDFPELYTPVVEGDNVYLIKEGETLVDQVGWSSNHGNDVSFQRFPDGYIDGIYNSYSGYNDASSVCFSNGFPTRNGSNREECPGFVVIGTNAIKPEGNKVKLIWTDPVWDMRFAGSKVIKSSSHFPQDIYDGTEVYDGTVGELLDTDIIDSLAYYYSVFAYTFDGDYSNLIDESCDSIPGVITNINDDPPSLPINTELLANYPNPFNSSTTIKYIVGESNNNQDIRLEIFNLLGERVAALVDEKKQVGEYTVSWDASEHTTGIYFAKLRCGDLTYSKKMVYLK
ncbi:MAG: T9SS type A sorting domain-containing protein [candidate division Zixibacteria bacterium]|nr:T9SS type A sorting domain-containing protein [candidate division Zixibacteria bacterium]